MAAKDGNLYELIYQADDGWFTRKCRKTNLTYNPLSNFVPSFLFSSEGKPWLSSFFSFFFCFSVPPIDPMFCSLAKIPCFWSNSMRPETFSTPSLRRMWFRLAHFIDLFISSACCLDFKVFLLVIAVPPRCRWKGFHPSGQKWQHHWGAQEAEHPRWPKNLPDCRHPPYSPARVCVPSLGCNHILW